MNAAARRSRLALVPVLLLAVVFVLNVRAMLPPAWRTRYSSSFADLAMPFAFYFLLARIDAEWPRLRPWWAKAGLVFAGCAVAELAQGAGLPLLGRTYDPQDFVMYAAGVLLAAVAERTLLPA